MITMKKSRKGSWVGRYGSIKIILQPHCEENSRGIVELPDGTRYIHGFFQGDNKEKLLRYTVQGFTHIWVKYPEFKEVYNLVFRTEDGVNWIDTTRGEP